MCNSMRNKTVNAFAEKKATEATGVWQEKCGENSVLSP